MKPVAGINPQTRLRILKDWEIADAAFGAPYERWVEFTAEKYRLPPLKIKSIIAQEAEAFLFEVRKSVHNQAQQVALLAGATVSRAYEVLAEAMNASRRRYLRSGGKPVIDEETGEEAYVDEPMIAERLRAAEMVIKVNGAFAPTQVEIEEKGKIIEAESNKLNPEQLEEKLLELTDVVRKLKRDYRDPTPRITGPKPRTSSRRSHRGPVLLDDYLHDDEGRAG